MLTQILKSFFRIDHHLTLLLAKWHFFGNIIQEKQHFYSMVVTLCEIFFSIGRLLTSNINSVNVRNISKKPQSGVWCVKVVL